MSDQHPYKARVRWHKGVDCYFQKMPEFFETTGCYETTWSDYYRENLTGEFFCVIYKHQYWDGPCGGLTDRTYQRNGKWITVPITKDFLVTEWAVYENVALTETSSGWSYQPESDRPHSQESWTLRAAKYLAEETIYAEVLDPTGEQRDAKRMTVDEAWDEVIAKEERLRAQREQMAARRQRFRKPNTA